MTRVTNSATQRAGNSLQNEDHRYAQKATLNLTPDVKVTRIRLK